MRASTLIGLVMGGILFGSQALAFQREGPSWAYMSSPMGENWVICPDRMPGEAVQRTKDGSAVWNYERFRFTFASEACLSDGAFHNLNGVNQIDFGPVPSGALAETVFFFSQDETMECDLRFNSAVNWYTGTGTPAANQLDWWSVATHEMGHCLGLAHEDNLTPPPVMQSRLLVGSVMRELTADDIAGRNAIYGQPQGNPGSSPAPSTPAVASNGGGGGCSLSPGRPADASSLCAALGNILLPMVGLAFLRIWSRWRSL